MSDFIIMKTLTLLVHAGLFGCFHNPPNSDMDYRILKVDMWSFFGMRTHTVDLGLDSQPKEFCSVHIIIIIIIIDHFYIALFSALEQTHCARVWFYMSE